MYITETAQNVLRVNACFHRRLLNHLMQDTASSNIKRLFNTEHLQPFYQLHLNVYPGSIKKYLQSLIHNFFIFPNTFLLFAGQELGGGERWEESGKSTRKIRLSENVNSHSKSSANDFWKSVSLYVQLNNNKHNANFHFGNKLRRASVYGHRL